MRSIETAKDKSSRIVVHYGNGCSEKFQVKPNYKKNHYSQPILSKLLGYLQSYYVLGPGTGAGKSMILKILPNPYSPTIIDR